MPEFKKISDIDITSESSWRDAAFLTLDIDWAHDDVLSYAVDVLERADVCATWFVTHETKILDRIRENPKFELGIHPNFNFLLSGVDRPEKSAADVVDAILKIVPEALSVRSHSMTQSTNLMGIFAERGVVYECNHFIPHQSGICLAPWKTWNGLIKVPYFWEDDVACVYGDDTNLSDLKNSDGLRVFDFHPIHLFLNTENMNRYELSRDSHRKPEDLSAFVNSDKNMIGACDKLNALLKG